MKYIYYCILMLAFLTVYSCAAPQHATQLVHHIRADTVYMRDVQYDSIYIYKDRVTDRSTDTLYVRDVSIEYRYRLLRDTIRLVQHDSIPYEVTVTETREIVRPLTWFDHLTRACFWIFVGAIIVWLVKLLSDVRTRRSNF